MRTAKWQIRDRLAALPGLQLRNVLDPAGDSGPFLLMLFPDSATADKVIAAVQAEGEQEVAAESAVGAREIPAEHVPEVVGTTTL